MHNGITRLGGRLLTLSPWICCKSTTLREGYGIVEFGFALPQWAAIDPLDEGTREVVLDGCWILLDPTGLLNQLLQQIVEQSK